MRITGETIETIKERKPYMARIRTIKPEFFRHEKLQDIERETPGKHPMLVFAGLFTVSDKLGRFEWRPRTLKLDILPFLDFDMGETLEILEKNGFVKKYEVNGEFYGFIPTFSDHQRITGKEALSPCKYPDPDKGNICETPGKHPDVQERKGKEREKERKGVPLFEISENEISTPTQKITFNFFRLFLSIMKESGVATTTLEKAKFEKWDQQTRLMIEKKECTIDQLREIYKWFNKRETKSAKFWASNVRSMDKLREKLPTILMQMKSENTPKYTPLIKYETSETDKPYT